MTQRIKIDQKCAEESPSEMDKITTNRVFLPAIRKWKKAGCQGYGIHMIFN